VGSSVCALDREISELLLKAKASPDIRSLCIDEYHSQVCIPLHLTVFPTF
jgi:hypothetical protein